MPLSILLLLIFVAVALLSFIIIYLLIPKKTEIAVRLEGLRTTTETMTLFEKPITPIQRFLGRLGAQVPIPLKDQGKYMRMLVAGNIKKERLLIFLGSKLGLAVILPTLYIFLYGFPVEKDPTMRLLFTGIFAIVGYLIPSVWLTRKVKKRQLQLFLDLPDVLDLMMVCVESGLSMEAAMVKVTGDPLFRKSPLIDEMQIALRETRAGKPRVDSLRDMGERTMVSDLKAFAAMLIQTERLGTSLVQALRVHADSLRKIRSQQAEEAASKIAIKLLFPLVFFIFPALLVVILGPAILRIMRLFAHL
jgi:tight adherence protein C